MCAFTRGCAATPIHPCSAQQKILICFARLACLCVLLARGQPARLPPASQPAGVVCDLQRGSERAVVFEGRSLLLILRRAHVPRLSADAHAHETLLHCQLHGYDCHGRQRAPHSSPIV